MKANIYIVPAAVLAALMAAPVVQAKAEKPDEFTECLQQVNEICKKEKGDEFSTCLEKQYKAKNCESTLKKPRGAK